MSCDSPNAVPDKMKRVVPTGREWQEMQVRPEVV
jgi:hypothetical protein